MQTHCQLAAADTRARLRALRRDQNEARRAAEALGAMHWPPLHPAARAAVNSPMVDILMNMLHAAAAATNAEIERISGRVEA